MSGRQPEGCKSTGVGSDIGGGGGILETRVTCVCVTGKRVSGIQQLSWHDALVAWALADGLLTLLGSK